MSAPICYHSRTTTVLDSFLSFANSLPADRREVVEEALSALMESYSEAYVFSPGELGEIDHRLREISPGYSSPASITGLFGKPFSA